MTSKIEKISRPDTPPSPRPHPNVTQRADASQRPNVTRRPSSTQRPDAPPRLRRARRAAAMLCAALTAVFAVFAAGCASKEKESASKLDGWLYEAALTAEDTEEELYASALSEMPLVVYSVSSRVFQAKEAFEKKYPGLNVEIKDIRSNDIVDMLKENYDRENYACDVVICSDCDGSLYKELIEPGIVYNYVPRDIAPLMKEGCCEPELDFLGEAMMFFYNTDIFESSPINNIWELTEDKYKGKIMMSSPLRSFSTYGFCAQTLHEDEKFMKAYEEYKKSPLEIPKGKTAAGVFWEKFAENVCFVNSNDEVLEGVGNSGDIWFGIMISSKYRYKNLGYHFAPVTRLSPFACVYTPNCIEMAGGAPNVNSAKLFIRFVLGGADGTSEGAAAFSTEGSWSTRTDMPDGSSIPAEDIDMIVMDKNYLYENRDMISDFFGKILERNINWE